MHATISEGTSLKRSFDERFFEKVYMTSECWPWLGNCTHDGYGRLGGVLAHRISYERFVGAIPDGFEIDHLCRNRACVRPDHLELVTHRENMIRRAQLVTHCPRGHEYTPENTYFQRIAGGRVCRQCDRDRKRPQTDERFPTAVTLLEERFPGSQELCAKCEKPLNDFSAHFPAELGGGCIPDWDGACELCWGVEVHEFWCEMARDRR